MITETIVEILTMPALFLRSPAGQLVAFMGFTIFLIALSIFHRRISDGKSSDLTIKIHTFASKFVFFFLLPWTVISVILSI